jgi:Sec-independent protein translocase protein TatA
MSDPNEPSQEEIEAYYAQLREAPVGDLLMQCVGMLAAGAEAKLGLPEARTLIDSMAAVVQIGEGHLGEAAEQLKGAVAQLQMAQVQVEKQLQAQQEGEGASDADDPTAQAAPPQAAPPQAPAPQAAQPQKNPTDKLWLPGR